MVIKLPLLLVSIRELGQARSVRIYTIGRSHEALDTGWARLNLRGHIVHRRDRLDVGQEKDCHPAVWKKDGGIGPWLTVQQKSVKASEVVYVQTVHGKKRRSVGTMRKCLG